MPEYIPFGSSQEAARAANWQPEEKEEEKKSWFPSVSMDLSAGINRRYDLDIHRKPDSKEPERNVPGVDALTGYNELSEEQKVEAVNKYPALKDISADKRHILYDNLKFKELFGNDPDYEIMKGWSKDARDKYYKDYVLNENLFSKYGSTVDDNTWAKIQNLEPESQAKLIESGYTTPQKIQEEFSKQREEAIKHPLRESLYRGVFADQVGETTSVWQKINDEEEQALKKNQKLLDTIVTQDADNKLHSEKTQLLKKDIYEASKADYEEGKIDSVDIDQEFESYMGGLNTAMPSYIYEAFKGGHELAHLDVDTKLKFIAEYKALKELYGEDSSITSRDLNMQRYIHGNQNGWDWIEDVGVGIATKAVAHTAQIGIAFGAMGTLIGGGEDGLARYLQGKRKDGSDVGWFINPKYWNGVDQFGSFSPTKIDDIYNRYNGINKHQWLTDVGRDMSFGTFAREGLKMAGYMIADGLLAKGVGAISPAGVAPYITAALSSASIAEAYGSGAFDEVLQEEMETINDRKAKDKADYLDEYFGNAKFQIGPRGTFLPSADIEGDEITAKENDIVNILNSKIQEKYNAFAKNNPETISKYSDEQLDELREKFAQEAWDEYVKEVGDEYDTDPTLWGRDFNKEEEFAKRRAAGAYLVSAGIEFNRYMANNLTWRKFLMTDKMKSTLFKNRGLQTMFDENGVAKAQYKMGPFGMFTTENEKLFKWYKVAQSVWGSGQSNFNDDLTTWFAKKYAITRFNDFISSGYDVDKYLSTVDYLSTFLPSFANGVSGLKEGFFNKRTWFSGAIGAAGILSPSLKIGKSKGKFNEIDLEREARKAGMSIEEYQKTDAFNRAVENGTIRKKSALERFHDKSFVYIPAFQTYFDAGMEADMNRAGIEDLNEQITTFKKLMDVVEAKEKDIDAISNIVAHLNSWEVNDMSGNEADARDAKTQAAIQLAIELEKVKYDSELKKNKFMTTQNQKLQDIVDGNISEEERNTLVAEFLEGLDSGNQSVKSDPDIQNKEQYAWERIQENAQKMLDTQKDYSRIHKEIMQSKEFISIAGDVNANKIAETLAANRMMLDSREARQLDMEKEIRGIAAVSETSSSVAEYGSKKGLQNAIKEQENTVKELEMSIQDLQEKVKTPLSRKQRRNAGLKAEYNVDAATLEMRKEELQEARQKLEEMKQDETDFSTVIRAKDIINLNPEQRAKMLDPENASIYNKRQRTEIEKARASLVKKGLGLTQTVQDAAIVSKRNRELTESNRRMLADTKGLADYLRYLDSFKAANLEDRAFYRAYRITEQKYQDYNTDRTKSKFVKENFTERGLDRLIKDHAEDKGLLENLRPIIRLRDNSMQLIGFLMPEKVQEQSRRVLAESINSLLASSRVTNEEQALRAIEKFAEEQTDTYVKEVMNKLLKGLKNLNYQIKATIPESEAAKEEVKQLKEQADAQGKAAQDGTKEPQVPSSTESAPTVPVTPASTEGAPLTSVAPAGVEQAPVEGVPPVSTEDVAPAAIPPASTDFTPRANKAVFDAEGRLIQPSAEMQAALAAKNAGTEVLPLTEKSAEDTANESGEQSDALLGNVHYEYDHETLKTTRVQKRKTPRAKNNSLDRFFQWADSKGLKIQKTIDEELGNIVKKFPNTKIQFMVVKGEGASDAMRNNIVLVTEYTEGIANLHSQGNGEPIQVGNKQYLVIGTLGFNPNSIAQQNSFNRIKKAMIERANSAFESSSAEYYVDEQMNTKISKFYAGRLTKQQTGEEAPTKRTLGELFADKPRNPGGITFNNAIFGVVFGEKGFVPSRNASETVYPPGLSETNQGRVFLMVKAANGNYIPVALSRVAFSELKEDSKLKDDIMKWVISATSESLAERKKAMERLSTLLVLDEKNNILVGSKDANTISIVRDGNIVKTWTLGRNFNRADFLKEFNQTPFIVNLTMNVLKNPTELKKYDAAGALITDVSILGTVNAAYDVFNIDSEGNPIEKEIKETAPKQKKTEPVYEKSAPINGKTYRKVGDTIVDENGKPIDETTKEGQKLAASAKYTMVIDSQRLSPIGHGEKFSYYMINQNLVVARDANNNCEVVVGAKARKIIEGFEAQRAKLEREEAAKKEAERLKAEQEAAQKALEEKPAVERAAELQVGISTTSQGFHQLDISDTPMRDYRQKLSSPTHKTPSGKNVAIWSENGTTYFVVEVSGRGGDNYTFSVNRTLTEEQIAGLLNAVEGIYRADQIKQAIKDYLTDQPKMPITPPIPEAPKQAAQPSGKAPITVKNTEKSYKFVELIQTKRRELNSIAKEKGWNWGSTPAEKAAFLVKLGILKNVNEEITMDMDSFCQMLKDCK